MRTPLYKAAALLLVVFLVGSACKLAERVVLKGPLDAGGVTPLPTAAPALIAATEDLQPPTELPATPTPLSTATPTQITPTLSPAERPGAEWTLLMYLDADDDQLEQDIMIDLNEMERVGSNEEVHIVVQIDRYQGAYSGDGDWTSAKRFHISQDGVMQTLASNEITDLGEINSGDANALASFITWGIQTYPAQKYALFMSDHGGGWTGGWSDPAPIQKSRMELVEIRDGIAAGLQAAGVEKFELISFDACLMGQFEVFSVLHPYARIGLASEETIPAIGLAYTGWMSRVAADPGLDGRRLAQAIAETYIYQDWRIEDDSQRRELFGPGDVQSIADEVAAAQTLSAVDLEAFPGVIRAVDSLSAALVKADQRLVAEARTYAQSYTNIFGEDTPPSFLDLGNLASGAARATGSAEVASAAQAIEAALQQALVVERHGREVPGSTGLSIYFPNSGVYQDWLKEYTYTTADFPETSSWDDFLSYHYYGTPFNPVQGQVVQPPAGSIISAPGAGTITLQPVAISAGTVAQGESVLITSQVSGDNIAYVFTFVGYLDQTTKAVLAADMSFIETEGSREVNGVYYPNFSGGPTDLKWEWKPLLFNLNDGNISGFALFEPDDYGAPGQSPTYAVYGIWHYADGSEDNQALVYFIEGEMKYAYAFSGEGGTGAPRQINPFAGDRFTVLYTVYSQDENKQVQTTYKEGNTFTLGDKWFTREQIPAPAGTYMVGFIAMDFDGNLYYQVSPLEVR